MQRGLGRRTSVASAAAPRCSAPLCSALELHKYPRIADERPTTAPGGAAGVAQHARLGSSPVAAGDGRRAAAATRAGRSRCALASPTSALLP